MKFTIKRSVLLHHLSNVSKAISSKTTIPILTGIKIEVSQNQMTLIGSDSEISIKSEILASDDLNELIIEKTGSVVLPARLFNEIIRKLPLETVTLALEGMTNVTIVSGNATFNLVGVEGHAYPHLPDIEDTTPISLPASLFKQVVNQTIFSTSNQETRPILTGVHLMFTDNHMTAVATDSHRLSKRQIPLASPHLTKMPAITIPKKSLLELVKIAEDDQVILLMVSNQQAIFILEHTTIYSRLLEGDYPEVTRLIPQDFSTVLTVPSQSFLQAIDRASLLSREGSSNIVQLEFDGQVVELSVRGNETGNVAETIDPKEITGNTIKISFNPEYMKDALRSFDQAVVKIQMQSPVRPLLLELETPSELAHNHLIQLLTPIRTHY